MAEAVAAVSLIASVLTLAQTCKKFLVTIQALQKEGCEISDTISDAAAQIPLLLDLVEQVKKREALETKEGRDSNLLLVINGCDRQIRALVVLVESTTLSEPSSAITVTRTAWRRLRRGKEIYRIQQSLEHYKTLLVLKVMQNPQDQSCPPYTEEGDAQSFHAPPLSMSKFIGRRAALEEIGRSSKKGSDSTSPIEHTTVILGMGGQGKTQLVQEYCRMAIQSKICEAIFWIDASSSDSAIRSYGTIAQKFAPDSKVPHSKESSTNFAMKKISKLHVPWILVFDNFDNPKSFRNINDYLPSNRSGLGAFLFTSRHHDVSSLGTTIFLNGMTEDEGLELFFHRMGQNGMLVTREQAAAFVARFGGLPLAIDQAASYMRSRKLTIDKFDKIFESQSSSSKVWSRVPHVWDYYKQKAVDDSENSVQAVELNIATTFELSLQQIESNDLLWNGAGAILSFLSLFDRSCISEELAIAASESTGEIAKCMQVCCSNGNWDKFKFQDLIVELYGLSILETIDLGETFTIFTLHPMVAEWLKLRVAPDQRSDFGDMAIMVMDTILCKHAETLDSLDFRYKEWILSNINSARASARYLKGDDSVLCEMPKSTASRFASFYVRCERLDSAVELYETLLMQVKDHASPDTFDLYHDLATCYVEKIKYAEAEKLYQKALDKKTELLGPDHESTLVSAQKLAMTYRRSLNYVESEKMIRYVVEQSKTIYGTDKRLYLVSLNTLAVNLRYQNRLAEAEAAAREAFEGVLKFLEKDYFTQIFVRRCLGLVLRDQGKLAEAAGVLSEGLPTQEKMVGPLNSGTLFTVTILQGIYERLGDEAQVQRMKDKMHGDLGRSIFQASSWSTDK